MCFLTIKHNSDMKPHRAKSRIVVMGNHEDRYWDKNINMPQFSPTPLYTNSPAWQLNTDTVFNKFIARTGFETSPYLIIKPLLSNHPLDVPSDIPMHSVP